MAESGGKGSRPSPNFTNGIETKTKPRDEEAPLEFDQLKQMYDNTVQNFVELLQQVDPEIRAKLTHPPPKPLGSEVGTKPSSTPVPKNPSVQFAQKPSHTQSGEELGSTNSSIARAPAPQATKLSPVIKPLLVDLAVTSTPILMDLASSTLPTVATAVEHILDPNEKYIRKHSPPDSSPQAPFNPFVMQMAQGPYGSPYGYPQDPYQQFSPDQRKYSPPSPFPGQGAPGFAQGHTQGPYQQHPMSQNPFPAAPYVQFPQQHPMTQYPTPGTSWSPPTINAVPPSGKATPESKFNPSETPQKPARNDPFSTPSVNTPSRGPSSSPTGSTPSKSPSPTSPQTSGGSKKQSSKKTPNKPKGSPEVLKVEGEVLKSLEDIDNQINVILRKLESR